MATNATSSKSHQISIRRNCVLLTKLFAGLILIGCSERSTIETLSKSASALPYIEGTPQYLSSPFVTAGDRVYMIGHQDGTFPDLGWHIEGEMGGIWDHPIKLMDGFIASLAINDGQATFWLDKAVKFVNYPVGNAHYFRWDEQGIAVERFQYVPDGTEGMVLEFRIMNLTAQEKDMTFSFTGMADLRPTWLGERTNMIDAEDEITFDEELQAMIVKDTKNPWYTAFGSSAEEVTYAVELPGHKGTDRKGMGKNGILSMSVNLKPNEEGVIRMFIAGSYKSEEILRKTFETLKKEGSSALKNKIARYEKINAASHLTIPDKGLEQMYEWLKYNTDWLVRHVPEEGVGISAGLPDYPWWFGADMAYSVQGILATGNHTLARNSIALLNRISQKVNGNGRIVHEVSTNGAVYNPGNVNETAQFITLIRTYYAWTGDKEFIEQMFPDVKKGIAWLLEEMDPDRNGYPNGSGMMEIPGLDKEMIDVAVYTQQALEAAAELARAVGDSTNAIAYQEGADRLKSRINSEWWNPLENSFGDFRGTVADARPVLQAALIRADTLEKPWAVAELKEIEKTFRTYDAGQQVPHVIYHNWVVNTPMETGVADMEKGKIALETAKKYENPYGVFVTGIDRTAEPDSVVLRSRKKTFSYLGAVMTLPTGVQAVAAARYGTPEEALAYLQKLKRSFSYALPGSMYEVSPDFGMITQAWNIYGVAVPFVYHFFGIQPKAYDQAVYLSPRMPASWKESSLENVLVGNNSLSFFISQKEDHVAYRITQTLPDWKVIVDIRNVSKVTINGEEKDITAIGGSIMASGREITVRLYR